MLLLATTSPTYEEATGCHEFNMLLSAVMSLLQVVTSLLQVVTSLLQVVTSLLQVVTNLLRLSGVFYRLT